MKHAISTKNAPGAIGPYSQAIRFGEQVYLSGQIPIDTETGEFISDDITEQTHQVLRNLSAVLDASGSDMDSVLKTTVFLKDMSDFAAMNEVYAEYFSEKPPARSTVQAAGLPRGARVEIDCIAFVK